MRLSIAALAVGILTTPAPATQAPPDPVARIAFELHRNKILVPVHIAGQGPFSFILDSGSPAMLLTSWTHARTLALDTQRRGRVSGAGDGAALPAGVSQPVDVGIGGVSLGPARLLVVELADQLAASSGRYYDGVIGRLLFDRYVVRIDFEQRMLELYEADAYWVPEDATVLPIRMEMGHPHVDTRVALANGSDIRVDLVIDTGARTALVLDEDPRSAVVAPEDAVEMIIGHGVRGWVRGKVAQVSALELNGLTVRDVLTAFVPDSIGVTPGGDGNLGVELLRRFVVTFDYQGNRMILEPTPRLRDPFAVDLSGITLRAGGEGWSELTVAEVRPGSPAFIAGVRAGDVIAAVDGETPATLADLERWLEQPRTVELTLNRADSALVVALELTPVDS